VCKKFQFMEDEWIGFRRRAYRAHLDRALGRAILHDLFSPPLFVLHLQHATEFLIHLAEHGNFESVCLIVVAAGV